MVDKKADKVDKKASYSSVVYPAAGFVARAIPEREWLLTKAIPHPGLGLLYAWRGSGKTFAAMSLAVAISAGTAWMGYENPAPEGRGTLYVDGEMPLGDLRARLDGLTKRTQPPPKLFILASEDLAVAHRNINLAQAPDRRELAEALLSVEDRWGKKVEFIVLDNWTSLVRGIDENDNSQMDALKEWLILLRHGDKSVLLVHHAGKSGSQRGGSAREDILDYSAKLAQVKMAGETTCFAWTWDKSRTGIPEPESFTMRLNVTERDMWLEPIKASSRGSIPKHDDKIIELLAAGPLKFGEIGVRLNLHDQQVKRVLDRLTILGKISWDISTETYYKI